jgi:hypothetical protein
MSTEEQVVALFAAANPVPRLDLLDPVEPLDLRHFEVTRTRSAEMQTRDRIDTDQEPDRPRKGLLIGVSAAAVVLIGALVIFLNQGEAPVADDTPVVTTAPESLSNPDAVDVATGFVGAYAASDMELAASYVAPGKKLSMLNVDEAGAAWARATGFQMLPGQCEEKNTTTAGVRVLCPYAYNALRSNEIGMGPYEGNFINVTVKDGKVAAASESFDTSINNFSAEMWEPFAAWIAATYPEDVTRMWEDSSQGMEMHTPAAIQLWQQHTKEYVDRVNTPPVDVGTAFLAAYAAGDEELGASYAAPGTDLPFGTPEWTQWGQATGFKVLPGTCEEPTSPAKGTQVRCTYEYHGLRSDEIGLGPFGDNWLDLTVENGEIVAATDHFEVISNQFSAQMWEPFAAWVTEAYPEDSAIMYTDSRQTQEVETPEADLLWEQHTKEYAQVVGG